MKKKPNIKPTEEDLKDWQSFIENINSIEDKDAPFDNLIIEKNNDPTWYLTELSSEEETKH